MKKDKKNKHTSYDYGTKGMTWQLSQMGFCKFPHTRESVRRHEQAKKIMFDPSKAMTKEMHYLEVYSNHKRKNEPQINITKRA